LTFIRNHLLHLLPLSERRGILASCEQVPLVRSVILWHPGQAMTHVYFPVTGLISVTATLEDGAGLEIAMVGREGALGAQVALGLVSAPLRATVQAEGWAWRLRTDRFQACLLAGSVLGQVLDRYAAVLMSQLVTSAICQCHHEVAPRLARWLMMNQDRMGPEPLSITQELLGILLGVRRVSITSAAGALQRRGLIAYQRGTLHILDRAGLAAMACACYRSDQASYAEVMGSGCRA
jgi:CRP-like cAMP-binding protein